MADERVNIYVTDSAGIRIEETARMMAMRRDVSMTNEEQDLIVGRLVREYVELGAQLAVCLAGAEFYALPAQSESNCAVTLKLAERRERIFSSLCNMGLEPKDPPRLCREEKFLTVTMLDERPELRAHLRQKWFDNIKPRKAPESGSSDRSTPLQTALPTAK